ncbi:MAG: TlpA disulfide reductase family protein [Prolixibacteraceae bacterium]|jgi:peroxiredoxin|nr:TlpA disulfide reductase family protein [Prolixibacteraceae bacterium]
MIKRILGILLIAVAVTSCSKSENFSIVGTITNSNSEMIYLDNLGISGSTPFDSSKIDSKGNFKLSGAISHPTFFLLRLNNQKFITLLVDSLEEINFSADYINFSNDYKVEGSFGSLKVKELNQQLAKTNNKIDSIKSLLTLCVDNRNYTTEREQWLKEMNSVYTQQKNFSKTFITENPFSLASVLAIYQKFNNGNYIVQDLQALKVAASALHSMYPNSVHAQTLYKDTQKLVRNIKNQEMTEFIEQYGKNSPEIILSNTKGDDKALSELEGKIVLLQFWSALDETSRVVNKVLKENYTKYNAKGFEIYQVSVDTNKEEWLKAVKQDQLTWTNVGDMQGSIDALNSYNIKSIPSNYLLNRDGSIIARNIKGPEIYKKLNEILN